MAGDQSPQSAIAHLSLTLEIPSTSSGSSSLQSSQTSSPVGILDSSSTTPTTTHTTPTHGNEYLASTTYASCPSLPMSQQSQPNLNVKFAPLPQLAPRKRRSTAPLGMAARSQLVNRRKKNYPHYYQEPLPQPEPELPPPPPSHDPMWTEEELAEARARQLAAAEKERKKAEAKANGGKGTEEDPFLVFGKLVKGASRQLWKKVAKKDKKGQETPDSAGEAGTHDDMTNNSEKEAEKLDVDGQEGRADSSSSEDEARPNIGDQERTDTPSSSEDTPPQVLPKEDEAGDVDQYIIPDFGQAFLPEDMHIGDGASSPELPESSKMSFVSPNRPISPSPSLSPTDAQDKPTERLVAPAQTTSST